MKTAILFSGGKDSCMSLNWAIEQGMEPVLVSLKSERDDSFMFHVPNIGLVKEQAEALGLPLVFQQTSGIKEEELKDLEAALSAAKEEHGVDSVCAGALASNYQKGRVEKIAAGIGLRVHTPYWGTDPSEYMNSFINLGFKASIVAVAAGGLTEEWLGREINTECIEDLKQLNKSYGVHIAGEGGEYETFVFDGPIFKKKIKILETETLWDGVRGELEIKRVALEGKE